MNLDNLYMNGATTLAPKTINPAMIRLGNAVTNAPEARELSDNSQDEGGKGGNGGDPASPPSPPSLAPIANIADSDAEVPFDDDIFVPAPSTNPVLVALRNAGLYRGLAGGQKHAIVCPWGGEHPATGDDAFYTAPSAHNPAGKFECSSCTQRGRRVGVFLDRLGVDRITAEGKPCVRMVKGQAHRVQEVAEWLLAQSGNFYQLGNTIVTVANDGRGGWKTEPANDQVVSLALSALANWVRYDGRSKSWQSMDVSAQFSTQLLKAGKYHHLPVLKGLARQPILRPNGEGMIVESGYDQDTGILAVFNGSEFTLPEPTEANARQALTALQELTSEFHFATDRDRSAATCAILTGAVRQSLPVAPAFNISASSPGSGKSYLADVIQYFAAPTAAQKISYPSNAEEAGKAMLSLMMGSPAVICFDDMVSNWFPYPAINRMLTSETISDRVLGSSRIATAGTATLVLGTGNNVRPLRDLSRRVVSIYLNPNASSIPTLRYERDPKTAVKQRRGYYVGQALTIVRAWMAAGKPMADVLPIASYEDWSQLCRHSLIWLGLPDPAGSLIEQVDDDPDLMAFGHLLERWYALFGSTPTTVRAVIERGDRDDALGDILLDLPAAERGFINRSKFGRYLSRYANRQVKGLSLRQAPTSERNAWSVHVVDQAAVTTAVLSVDRPVEATWKPEAGIPAAAIGEIF